MNVVVRSWDGGYFGGGVTERKHEGHSWGFSSPRLAA